MLREVIVKIGLEQINIQEGVTVEVLLDSRTMEFVMSLEFTRKQRFNLKKIKRLIFNKEGPIEYTVEVNIYYQEYRKRIEINVIEEQKQNIILEILQLTCYNPEIDWRTEEVKMMRCSEECKKQQRLKQEKAGQQKQKEEEDKEEVGKK